MKFGLSSLSAIIAGVATTTTRTQTVEAHNMLRGGEDGDIEVEEEGRGFDKFMSLSMSMPDMAMSVPTMMMSMSMPSERAVSSAEFGMLTAAEEATTARVL